MTMVQEFEFASAILNTWEGILWGIAWQAGVIGLLIVTVVMWKKRWGSSLKYWLLVVALVKFLVPPFLALPTGILGLSSAYITTAFQTVSTTSTSQKSARTNVTPAVREGRPSPAVLPPESTETFIPPFTEPTASVPKRTNRVQSSAQEAVVESAPAISWGSIAFIAYLMGVFAGGVLILRQRIRLAGIVSRSTVATTDALGFDVGSIPVQLRTRKQPRILISEEVGTPMAFGILRPTILLPKTEWSELSMLDRRMVLYHELAHLRRRDPMINGMQLVVRTSWWCHPVAHLVNGLLVKVREECCDDLLLREELASPVEYSEVLLRSVSRFRTARMPMVLEMARHPLEPRLKRILDGKVLRLPRLDLKQMCLLLLVAAVMLPGMRSSTAGGQQEKSETGPADEVVANSAPAVSEKEFTIQGFCVESDVKTPLPEVKVLLYKTEGFFAPAEKIAEAVSEPDGSYEFKGLVPPRLGDRLFPLQYLCFGIAEGRAIGSSFVIPKQNRLARLVMVTESGSIQGRVVNDKGEPVSGAVVTRMAIGEQYVPEIQTSRTNQEGHFTIRGIPVFRKGVFAGSKYQVQVLHEDYPTTYSTISSLDEFMEVKLETGCEVTGSIHDEKTQRPSPGILVTFQDINESKRFRAQSDSQGRYRKVIPEGRYHITAESADRVSVAILDHECIRGEKQELPQLTMIEGGFIEGRVLNSMTGEPIFLNQNDDSIGIGLYGPSSPRYRAISPIVLTEVDEAGRYRLRAAPGENYPYFVNQQGDRMAWDTQKQSPVLVKSGEITEYDMLVTPSVTDTERLKQSREIFYALPEDIPTRIKAILVQLRKLNHTVDETEIWTTLIRELVRIGPDGVPQLVAELDETTEDKMIRRLGFTLRAIGDPRAVPGLIRALPKTLTKPGSDFGLLVEDDQLTQFMQQHDLDSKNRGKYFSFGRAFREIVGALHKLTGQDFNDFELNLVHLSEDPRRAILQRRLFDRQASLWENWWKAHSGEMTEDRNFHHVNLQIKEEPLPPLPGDLGPTARLVNEWSGMTLSPFSKERDAGSCFYDLDTGYSPKWPENISSDQDGLNGKELAKWAKESGIDLMCVTHKSPDGKITYELCGFELTAWELSPREVRNLDRSISAGIFPSGTPVSDLLIPSNSETNQPVPDSYGTFAFTTREGTKGLIEIGGRVNQVRDLTGQVADVKDVGSHLGVRFNVSTVIP